MRKLGMNSQFQLGDYRQLNSLIDWHRVDELLFLGCFVEARFIDYYRDMNE